MNPQRTQILPSLLAADYGHLADACQRAEAAGADELHLDLMDGHFVPNISFGPDIVKMARRACGLPLNVHLMFTHPDRYADRVIAAGAATVLFHVEVERPIAALLDAIRAAGVRPGLTLNPATPAEAVFPYLDRCGQILCMTVDPGYGGQPMITGALRKIAAIRRQADAIGCGDLSIMVDGGVTIATAPRCAASGADALVAGSSLYGAADMAAAIRDMRAAAAAAYDRDGAVSSGQ